MSGSGHCDFLIRSPVWRRHFLILSQDWREGATLSGGPFAIITAVEVLLHITVFRGSAGATMKNNQEQPFIRSLYTPYPLSTPRHFTSKYPRHSTHLAPSVWEQSITAPLLDVGTILPTGSSSSTSSIIESIVAARHRIQDRRNRRIIQQTSSRTNCKS